MSLIRQLWLAVVIVMALAFGGTFLLSTAAARTYFADQLTVKNIDNVNALALSISQLDKDPVTLELLLSAQFDAGHYRLIKLEDPDGKVLVERRNDEQVQTAPAAFVSALKMHIPPGIAQIQDGWKQFGTLTLESHDQYAYAELWESTLRLLGWFVIAAIVVGAVGSLLLKTIIRPLDSVVDQAEAMGRRQFITQREPSTIEFRQLVRAMNQLSERVQQMLKEQSQRVERLRLVAQTDALTGLSNRETFVAVLDQALQRDDQAASGSIVVVQLNGLAELNREIGREACDQVLQRAAKHMLDSIREEADVWTLSRLRPAEFALLAPANTDALKLAARLLDAAELAVDRADNHVELRLLSACSRYEHGETRAAVLGRLDVALGQAASSTEVLVQAQAPEAEEGLPTDLESWRQALLTAIDGDGVRLARFGVRGADGNLIHHESPVRLRIGDQWLPASRFLAWTARLGLMQRLERRVVQIALENLARELISLSVNISPESFCDADFLHDLEAKLRSAPQVASRLWLDVPEFGALRHLPAFRAFCHALKPLGCWIGLKHAGQQFSRISEFHDLGLDYLKVDGAIIRGVSDGGAHALFLRSLCTVSHAIGMQPIATGVGSRADIPTLSEMGIAAFTGPAVGATSDDSA